MIDHAVLHQKLTQLESRIARLESLVLKPKRQSGTPVDRTSLPKLILALREKGFFAQPKTAKEVHAKLKVTYHCDINRVAMALLRLGSKRSLRKSTKSISNKQYQSYVW